MKKVFTLFLLIYSLSIAAQQIEKLEKILANATLSKEERINTLNKVSLALAYVDPVRAIKYSNQALKLATETLNRNGIAYAYRNLSSVHSYNENYFVSMEYLQRALDIFKDTNDSIGIANCYISLGHTYRRLNNREEELWHHRKSYEIFTRLNIPERIGVSAHNYGESLYIVGDLAESEKLTKQAIRINDSINRKTVLSSCYKVLGLIEFNRANYIEAENYFQRVLEISESLGENSQKIATLESIIKIAEIRHLQGEDNEYLLLLMEARSFCQKNALRSSLIRIYRMLINYYSKENNQVKVRELILSSDAVADSLKKLQLEDRFHLVNSIVEVHELSKSSNELQYMNSVQSQRIKNRNVILLVIAIFTIILLFILSRLSVKNKKLVGQYHLIEAQKADLKRLNLTKDKFFSIVSHDLKAPLNSLKSFSGLLIGNYGVLSKEELIKMGNYVDHSVDNTIKMADNLITWANLQMNDIQCVREKFALMEVVAPIYSVFKDIALKKEIAFHIDIDETVFIEGDKNQVEFIIRNLVNNAVKFTAPKGTVELKAEKVGNGKVTISVRDNGVGMSKEMVQKLFDLGSKNSSSGTAGEKGTGLGLMLSYEFLTLNNGEIEIKSEVGKGSTFYITFDSP